MNQQNSWLLLISDRMTYRTVFKAQHTIYKTGFMCNSLRSDKTNASRIHKKIIPTILWDQLSQERNYSRQPECGGFTVIMSLTCHRIRHDRPTALTYSPVMPHCHCEALVLKVLHFAGLVHLYSFFLLTNKWYFPLLYD